MLKHDLGFILPLTLGGFMVVAIGCRHESEPGDLSTQAASEKTVSEQSTDTIEPETPAISNLQKSLAVKAKDALFETLSGRLMEVMQTKGPVAAIEVCSEEAAKIADQVGSEHGVRIGRTSFKLRNPKNAPRDWVKPFVEAKADTPEFVALNGGQIGALFPIHLNVKCLMCHGGPDDILDNVKSELAKRYPDDAATGFKQGELRGWFWVEIPSDAS